MENFDLFYSAKNIPTPKEGQYIRTLIVKADEVLARMRWKAHYFDSEATAGPEYMYEIKTRSFPPRIVDLEPFEYDLLKLISGIRFHDRTNPFQQLLRKDLKKFRASDKIFIPSDKTKNIYEVDRELHAKLVTKSITQKFPNS